MKYLIIFILFSSLNLSAKIYDCFFFNNEIQLLEIRFSELYDSVDKFILIESCEWPNGTQKPLYFLENRSKFEKYSDKIINLVVSSNIELTYEQRQINKFKFLDDFLLTLNCDDDDIICISNVEQIINNESIPKIKKILLDECLDIFSIKCGQVPTAFYVNRYFDYESFKNGIKGSYVSTFKKLFFNENIYQKKSIYLFDSGWVFYHTGNLYQINERNKGLAKCPNHYKIVTYDSLRNVVNGLIWTPINEKHPKCIQDNQQYYIELGLIDIDSTYLSD